jgi:hypothetical protein
MSLCVMGAMSAAFGPLHTKHSEGMQVNACGTGQEACP